MNKGLFLDRDGVINVDKKYNCKLEDLVFIDGIKELIKAAKLKSYKVICITNQSGIARGLFKEKDLQNYMHYLNQKLKESIDFTLDSYYFCPHHPNGIIKKYSYICNCRKPATGLFESACDDFQIDCKKSVFIGDKLTDIEAAQAMKIEKIYYYSTSDILPESSRYVSINNMSKVELI